ncbi:Similar to S.cerevisiae protein VMA21 (Integral membrane protein required for V-ATPase function) [Malassezia sympodialis ATCC 42132]|uniref:Similar to S.cerevisiae protein VMA21 (Integral membrane protein required for V-ATPase function) n=1 Tax=Malassezia sympodialis (strain ATCC 42132) TaxID=1230383 RepID=A0A1M8A859_MALS4|nr:Similar to S.cerevisiae protein VMA21 (Integral membrane protein required for V-ATPase function) [Malassezia sympodialis ATCC 42132]
MSLDPTPSRVAKRGPDPARGVYIKLALFSVALFVAPITAYYLAKDRWLAGNTVYAGGLAALVANLVLGGYIFAACLEDDGPRAPPKETKKTQ